MLEVVSRSVFDSLRPVERALVHPRSSRFALLRHAGGVDGISWLSSSIEPIVIGQPAGEVLVAIDQRVVCIAASGEIVFSVALTSSVLEVRRVGAVVAVRCELELLLLNPDWSLVCSVGFSALSTDMRLTEAGLIVRLEAGAEVVASPRWALMDEAIK